MRETEFHEDDYCQLELLPEANWDFCAREMSEIDRFAAEHRDAAGWTDIYVRKDNPHPVSELQIDRESLASAIQPGMPPFDRVLTGYNFDCEARNTLAFGPNYHVTLFAEHDDAGIVSAIWLDLAPRTSTDASTALNAFRAFSQWPLVLADWGWSVLLRISDSDALARYLAKRVDVFSKPD